MENEVAEFNATLRALLELLVVQTQIPGMPRSPLGSYSWDLNDEAMDQRMLESPTAIAVHLIPLQVAHEHLKAVKPPSRESRKIKQATLAMSESYVLALRAKSIEYWLTGTSIAGLKMQFCMDIKIKYQFLMPGHTKKQNNCFHC